MGRAATTGLSLLCAGTVSCARSAQPWQTSPLAAMCRVPSAEAVAVTAGSEYAIFRLLLLRLSDNANTILLVDAARPRGCEYPVASEWITHRDSSLLTPFIMANLKGLRFTQDSLRVAKRVVLLRHRPRTKEQWALIPSQYDRPSAVIEFSRVGFSSDGVRAVVEVATQCAWGLCGEVGYFFLASDAAGTWTVIGYKPWGFS